MEARQEKTPETVQVKRTGRFKRFLIITFLIFFALWWVYYFICGITYSEGTRSGILIKVSKRGYVFKTYEGELYVGGVSQGEGAVVVSPQIFKFSVRRSKEEVYKKMEQMQGSRVVLHYKQVFKNFFWQGDSDYFVDEIKVVNYK